MNYLTQDGYFVASSESPIFYDQEMRYWLVGDTAYSDFDGTLYASLENPENPPPQRPVIIPVPSEVTPRQARLALALSPATDEVYPHLLAQLEAAFGNLQEPQKTIAKITWEYSISVEHANPLIAQMQQVVGFTSEQIDDLFRMASTL